MPERLPSIVFWAVFAGIIFAAVYPTIEAMRDDQPNLAASPSPSVGVWGPATLPVRLSPTVRPLPLAAHRPVAVRSPIAVPSLTLKWPHSQSAVASTSHPPLEHRSRSTVGLGATRAAAERHWYDAAAFLYSGRWEHVRRRDDGRSIGSSSRSFHPGSQARLAFDGRSVRLYGVMGPGGGLGLVSIDGRQRQFVSFYAPVKFAHALVYSSPQLPTGPHRMTISVVADPSLGATRARYVNIRGADV